MTSLLSVLVFIWVVLDAMYCDNFNPKRVKDYVKMGYELDLIHYELFMANYANLKENLVSAVWKDIYDFFYVIHRTFQAFALS